MTALRMTIRRPRALLLPIAQLLWLVLAAWSLIVHFASVGANFQLILHCPGVACPIDPAVEDLGHMATRPVSLAIFDFALTTFFTAVFHVAGFVIFWRRRNDLAALFVSITLIVFSTILTLFTDVLMLVSPGWALPVELLTVVGWWAFIMLFYLFPDGRFVPRWTIIPAGLWTAFQLSRFTDLDWAIVPYNWSVETITLVLFGFFLTGLVAQVYRYRRVATPTQQQQTKWIIWGMMTAVGGLVLVYSIQGFFPDLAPPGTLAEAIMNGFAALGLLMIPISIGFAMLRYRLWDVDILIRRTLVYSVLTVLLALVYSGTIILMLLLFDLLTPQSSQPAVVVSTLVTAGVFTPLRQRVQSGIDRRFYRRKYDAQQTVRQFAERVRNDVELDALAMALLETIDETIQPTRIDLWLRPLSAHEAANS